jgi:hypothetical protein
MINVSLKLNTMRKKFTTVLAVVVLLAGAARAQVVFDPATYPADSLPDGMTIVDIEGTKYLKAALNGWSSWIKIWDVTIAPGHNRFKAEAKFEVGQGGFELSNINTFLKLSTPDWTELIATGQQSTADFSVYKATDARLTGGTEVGLFQIAGQERTGWSAVVGDTLYVGKVVLEHPDAFLDPLLVPQDSLPAGWTIDTIGSDLYFQVVLDGWNSFWEFHTDIGSYTVPGNVKAFKTMAKYAVGSGGFELGVINTFLKFSDPSWTEVVALGKSSSAEFAKYNSSITSGAELGVFQVAGQETQGWSAVVGDTLWVGIVLAERADSLKITSAGGATSIEENMGTLKLTANLYPADLAVKTVLWSSSDEGVATVNGSGLVSALANGVVTITAAADDGSGVKDDFEITITNQVVLIESITVTSEGDVVTIDTQGGTLQMYAEVLPEEADENAIEWSLAPEGLATIDENGLLTAVDDGTVTVTATATDGSGISGSLDITISGQHVSVEQIKSRTLVIYPNPVGELLFLENAGSVLGIDILNVNGTVVRSISNISSKMTIDVSDLANGIYFVRSYEEEQVHTYKLVK